MIPKPKNPKPFCSQPSIPLPIIRISPAVLSAVHFDHHFLFQTHKVNDIGSDGSLPAKFVAVNLAQPQVPPESSLSIRWITSQLSGSRNRCRHVTSPILTFPLGGGRDPRRKKLIETISPDLSSQIRPCILPCCGTQRQLPIYLIQRALSIRAMLPRPGAAARMVGNFDQREVDHTKKLRLGSAQLHED